MSHPLAPTISSDQARVKMGDSPQWINFARRIQHHPSIKKRLISIQKGKCAVCDMPVNMADVVHHVSYLARCHTDRGISIPNPSEKRPERINLAPPCDGCFRQEKCLRLLALVHNRCHLLIHKT